MFQPSRGHPENTFLLPDIYIWTRILMTLLAKCANPPRGWPLVMLKHVAVYSVNKVVLT